MIIPLDLTQLFCPGFTLAAGPPSGFTTDIFSCWGGALWRDCNLTAFKPCLTGPVDFPFASRQSPGGYLCETRILLLALSRYRLTHQLSFSHTKEHKQIIERQAKFVLHRKLSNVYNTEGVIINVPSRKKCLKLWLFLAVVYNVVFLVFSFFLAQRKANLHVGGFISTHSTQWPLQKAMKSHLFFKSGFFLQDAWPK